mgnify:CR=1 FL=1
MRDWRRCLAAGDEMQFESLIEARLQRRYKRFLADVELASGEVITVHCPNTGAMTGCAEPGSRVWLSTSDSKTRKYPNTWELVETSQGMACIHSAKANQVVKEAFVAGSISGFKDYPELRSEVKYGKNSRADLLLTGGTSQVYVEVKSVTLCEEGGQGLFPDAVSERGRKHLKELQGICDRHTRAVLLFCVFHEGIQQVSTAGDIDPLYRQAMLEALDGGVEVLAFSTRVNLQGVELSHQLQFTVDPEPRE